MINPHIKAIYDYYLNLCSDSVKSEIDIFSTTIKEKIAKHLYGSELKIFDKDFNQDSFSVSLKGKFHTIKFNLTEKTDSGYLLTFSIGYDLFDKNYTIDLELKNSSNKFIAVYEYAYADNAEPLDNLALVGSSGLGGEDIDDYNFFHNAILIEKIFENYFNLEDIEDLLSLQLDYSYDIKNNEILKSLKKMTTKTSQQSIKKTIKHN